MKKPASVLVDTLKSDDFGFTEAGGNGRVKKSGKNVLVYDSFYYGGDEILEKLTKHWSEGGTYSNYFKEEFGITVKVVATGSDFHSKVFGKNLGAAWVELEVA